MDKNERRLSDEIKSLLKQMETLIYNSYLSVINLFQVKNSLSGNTPFWFSRNAAANKQTDKLISDFNKRANALFLNGIERSWKIGEENALDKIRLAFSGDARQRKAFDQMRAEATRQQRDQSSQGIAKRYADGINLSGRVWKLGNGMKQEIEAIVQNAMKEGKTPDRLAGEIKKYLNEPEKLFRKVRNKDTGELELSEAAKKYKPGQGVYRSAYKNAMRLARTEIHAAYCRAAWESFQADPRITGIRISLSNNHTCINPRTGKPEPFHDICDELAGDYPKSFLWTGWHPQCRCVMNPVTVSGEEATRYIDAKVKGEKYEPERINSVPSQFQKWMKKNSGRIDAANNRGTIPCWIKDNSKFAGIKVNPINSMAQPEIREAAARKYNSYGNEWEKAYFDKFSGGYNVYHKEHKFSTIQGGGEAEKTVGKMLAKYNGKRVEFLPEGSKKSPDVKFDGKTWDIKFINEANENSIREAIKNARKADNAIFYWNKDNKLELLEHAIHRSVGYFKSKNKINTMPDVYYLDESGLLKLLWGK